RTSLQRVIVTREGVGVGFWRLMNGEEGTRIFSRKRKRRLLSEQGGASAATRNHRRADSWTGEDVASLSVRDGHSGGRGTTLVQRVYRSGSSEPVAPLEDDLCTIYNYLTPSLKGVGIPSSHRVEGDCTICGLLDPCGPDSRHGNGWRFWQWVPLLTRYVLFPSWKRSPPTIPWSLGMMTV